MEKVFAMDAKKFNVAKLGSVLKLGGPDRGPPPRYGDYASNRKFIFFLSISNVNK